MSLGMGMIGMGCGGWRIGWLYWCICQYMYVALLCVSRTLLLLFDREANCMTSKSMQSIKAQKKKQRPLKRLRLRSSLGAA
jgi:hypothetical protein